MRPVGKSWPALAIVAKKRSGLAEDVDDADEPILDSTERHDLGHGMRRRGLISLSRRAFGDATPDVGLHAEMDFSSRVE